MGSEPGKEGVYDTFFAGLLGGYLVFGRRSRRGHVSSVSKQIVVFGKSFPSLFYPPALFISFARAPVILSVGLMLILVLCSVRESMSLSCRNLYQALCRHHQGRCSLETDRTRCVARLRGS